VSLATALERHGGDALRYFLLREIGFEGDGNFTWERFDARYTADLADTLGNLVSRSLSMIHRYRAGTVPAGATDPALETDARAALAAYAGALDASDLSGGASHLIELATRANRYVEERAPWKLAKDAGQAAALDTVLATLARTVARLAVLALPFMPGKAAEIWDALGTGRPIGAVRWEDGQEPAVAGLVVAQPPILYPKPVAGTVSR
jgi:methionyl-tRNA synthetase